MKSKVLMVLAGAALSSVALAATPDKDRAYAAELSADAATRSSALANGEDRFKLTAGDSTLYIGGFTQFRWNADFRSKNRVGNEDDYTQGFNIPNTRVKFWGNTWTKELTYAVDFNLGGSETSTSQEGTAKLLDAEFRYTWDNGFYVRGGQFKLPLLREELVGDEKQLAVNRSQVNRAFTAARSQGLELGYRADSWRFMAMFSDGIRAANSDFNNTAEADFAVTARAEWQAMGSDWSRWNDFTSWRESDSNGLLFGVAGHYQVAGKTGDSISGNNAQNVDAFIYTADVSYEASGWNLYGAFIGSRVDPQGGTKLDDFGWLAQGGFFVTDQVELFGRYDGIRADKDRGTSNRTFHFLTAGANYYVSPRSHTFKLTGGVVWSLSKTGTLPNFLGGAGTSSNDTQGGVLGQEKKGEIALQLQAQVIW